MTGSATILAHISSTFGYGTIAGTVGGAINSSAVRTSRSRLANDRLRKWSSPVSSADAQLLRLPWRSVPRRGLIGNVVGEQPQRVRRGDVMRSEDLEPVVRAVGL